MSFNALHWFRPHLDPVRNLELHLRVFKKRQEQYMAALQEVAQKSSDLVAALNTLSTSVDTLKASHAATATTLSPENQAIVDAAVGSLDAALATTAALQTKVNNP